MVFRIVMKADETLKCVLVCCLQLAACKVSFPVTGGAWNLCRRCIIKFALSYLTLLLIHSKILLLIFRFATVAHLAEQHIRNVQVAGSIPASGSTKLRSQHRSFFMQGNIAGNISCSGSPALLKLPGVVSTLIHHWGRSKKLHLFGNPGIYQNQVITSSYSAK